METATNAEKEKMNMATKNTKSNVEKPVIERALAKIATPVPAPAAPTQKQLLAADVIVGLAEHLSTLTDHTLNELAKTIRAESKARMARLEALIQAPGTEVVIHGAHERLEGKSGKVLFTNKTRAWVLVDGMRSPAAVRHDQLKKIEA